MEEIRSVRDRLQASVLERLHEESNNGVDSPVLHKPLRLPSCARDLRRNAPNRMVDPSSSVGQVVRTAGSTVQDKNQVSIHFKPTAVRMARRLKLYQENRRTGWFSITVEGQRVSGSIGARGVYEYSNAAKNRISPKIVERADLEPSNPGDRSAIHVVWRGEDRSRLYKGIFYVASDLEADIEIGEENTLVSDHADWPEEFKGT